MICYEPLPFTRSGPYVLPFPRPPKFSNYGHVIERTLTFLFFRIPILPTDGSALWLFQSVVAGYLQPGFSVVFRQYLPRIQ